ncbi:hypothetical protein P5673_023754 [Acropora cervicornis]|uniref:Uncharacterized protein n=1 Tax=Acropora cervicornis TaxID=6130 RepID=A0AAD9Q5N9_ACRCE|nr:hypothetical protein P5673_023754 [Acropora cervicornis]
MLQSDLDSLGHWANTWQLRFNEEKCDAMCITHSRDNSSTDYTHSLELTVGFPIFMNAIFAGNGLIYVLCSGEYFECAILLDCLYLGVSSMHLDILFLDTMFCGSTLLHGVPLSVSVCINLFFDIRNIRFNLHFALLCHQRSVLIRHAPLTLPSAQGYREGQNHVRVPAKKTPQQFTQDQLMTVDITALSAFISSEVKQAAVEALAERTQPSSDHSPQAPIAEQSVADAVGREAGQAQQQRLTNSNGQLKFATNKTIDKYLIDVYNEKKKGLEQKPDRWQPKKLSFLLLLFWYTVIAKYSKMNVVTNAVSSGNQESAKARQDAVLPRTKSITSLTGQSTSLSMKTMFLIVPTNKTAIYKHFFY